MSYWVYLKDKKGNIALVKSHEEGGTYVLGGTCDAELNITYNYGKFYSQWLDPDAGLMWLNEKKAEDTVRRLELAVKALGIERDEDYYAMTAGNAGYALAVLLDWAKQRPQTIFMVHQ